MIIRPITLRQARAFVYRYHRHNQRTTGGLWALALMRDDELVGVAIAGRPVSEVLQRRGYCEIVRVCVVPDVRNGCSMLYGACRRVAQAMGYERFVSYTLTTEPGSSLLAAGFKPVAKVRGREWSSKSRPRLPGENTEDKVRWEAL